MRFLLLPTLLLISIQLISQEAMVVDSAMTIADANSSPMADTIL